MVYRAGHSCHTMRSEAKSTFPLLDSEFSSNSICPRISICWIFSLTDWAYVMPLLLFETCRFTSAVMLISCIRGMNVEYPLDMPETHLAQRDRNHICHEKHMHDHYASSEHQSRNEMKPCEARDVRTFHTHLCFSNLVIHLSCHSYLLNATSTVKYMPPGIISKGK
jgi:hypothetical protein